MRFKIQTRRLQLSPRLLSLIERQLRFAFSPCLARDGHVQVNLLGAGRPASREVVCRLVVRLPRAEDLVVTSRHERLLVAVNRAAHRAAAAVRRRVGRRRTLSRRRPPARRMTAIA